MDTVNNFVYISYLAEAILYIMVSVVLLLTCSLAFICLLFAH